MLNGRFSLAGYIMKEYGIPMCVRQYQRLLCELAFALPYPQTFLSKGSEDSVAR